MTIRNNARDSQYETNIDGHLAFITYEMDGPHKITFTHTTVPDALAGRGVASALAKFALDDARAQKLKVVAQCPFVASYIRKHAEYQDLVK